MNEMREQGREEEKRWQEAVSQIVEKASMSESRQARMLENIHMEIQERSKKNMRRISGKKVVLAVALITALAATTAVGAGKIAHLSSSHSVDEIDFREAREVMESATFQNLAKAVQNFEDGTEFKAGYEIEVKVKDENGNKVGSYPEIMINYEGNLTLSIYRPMEGVQKSNYPVVCSEIYEEIPVDVTKMDYLFLPPDAKVSEEDQKRQEEGTLEISYGTDKEERNTFLGAQWEEDGLTYLLFTMEEGVSEEDMLKKAKEIIDVER